MRIVAATVQATPSLLALIAVAVVGLAAVALQLWRRGSAIRAAPRPIGRAVAPEGPQTEIDEAVEARMARRRAQTGEAPSSFAMMLAHGPDAFAARALSAMAAGRSLDLMYYAWSGDAFGRLLLDAVWRAAERGVQVRLLIDDFNAQGADAALLALDLHPNIEVRVHNPLWVRAGLARAVETLLRFARVNHRMHNKCWIADGRVAIVGGRNIEDRYFEAASQFNFRDLDMLVAGPVVAQASSIFDEFWNHPTACPLAPLAFAFTSRIEGALEAILRSPALPETRAYVQALADTPSFDALLERVGPPRWAPSLSIRSDPPGKWRESRARAGWIVTQLWPLLRGAQHEALIVSPYFVPRRRLSAQLTRLARDGTRRVVVVTNSLAANDVAAVHGGYMRYRRKLLRGRVKLFEVRAQPGDGEERSVFGSSGASLHTKAMLFDGRRGFVGSFNMDPRSASVNSEMGVFFDDEALGVDLRAEIERLRGPALSYEMRLDGRQLIWVDGLHEPPRLLNEEPLSTLMQRMIARVAGWLPIEQEL
jgi:putative cardiolipin synthase